MKNENLKLKILCAFVPLWLCASAFGLVADINNDNIVDQFDLQIFCEQWLDAPGTHTPSADFDNSNFVDFKDFAILAGEWQGHLTTPEPNEPPHENLPPSANDISVSASAYIPQTITLSAADDGYPIPPGKLRYVITQLPADANAKVGGTKSGEQSPIRQSDLPYKLSTWGDDVIFATSTVGLTSFKYKVFDGNLYSDEKTVSITVAANPKDCLSFDGSGYVTIPDNSRLDLEPNRAVGVCFETPDLYRPILQKWSQGKNGYKMSLVGGRVVVDIFSETAGKVATISSWYKYNRKWANVVFAYNAIENCVELFINSGESVLSGTNYWYYDQENYWAYVGDSNECPTVPAGDYTNDCNLVIGENYRGELDGIRTYTLNMLDVFRTLATAQARQSAGNTESYVPTPIVRFTCNYDGTNNTATQIYDDKASHLIGTISDTNHVKYLPFIWFYPPDSAAFQQVIR